MSWRLVQGDSPNVVAAVFGAKHNLPAEAVSQVAAHITTRAGAFLKKVFFYLPFYVEVEGKSKVTPAPP